MRFVLKHLCFVDLRGKDKYFFYDESISKKGIMDFCHHYFKTFNKKVRFSIIVSSFLLID